MKFFNIGNVYPALFITYANAATGLMGIFATIAGNVKLALVLLVLAALCDVFDGVVARRSRQTNKQKEMGVTADTLADAVSFGVFPAVFLCVIGSMQPLFCIASAVYMLAVLHRLTIFNVTGVGEMTKTRHFIGLPSIAIVVVLPLIYLVTKGNHQSAEIIALVMIGLAVLNVSNLRIPKSSGKNAYIGYVLVATLLVVGILWL